MSAGTWMSVASTAASTYAQYEKSKREQELNERNADIAEADALAAEKAAADEAATQRKKVQRLLATQSAKYAAAGVKLSGSALDVLAETYSEGEADAMAILARGATEASRYRSAAGLYRDKAKYARRAGYYSVGTGLLTSGSKLSYDWEKNH